MPKSYWSSSYFLQASTNLEKPVDLIEIKMNEAHEELQFKYIKVVFKADYLIFGLKEQLTNKVIGQAKINLK